MTTKKITVEVEIDVIAQSYCGNICTFYEYFHYEGIGLCVLFGIHLLKSSIEDRFYRCEECLKATGALE